MSLSSMLSLVDESFVYLELSRQFNLDVTNLQFSSNGSIQGLNGGFLGLKGGHCGAIVSLNSKIGSAWNNTSLQNQLRLEKESLATKHQKIETEAKIILDQKIQKIQESTSKAIEKLEQTFLAECNNVSAIARTFTIVEYNDKCYPILRFSTTSITNDNLKVKYNGTDYTEELETVTYESALKFQPDKSKWQKISNFGMNIMSGSSISFQSNNSTFNIGNVGNFNINN